MKIKSGLEVAGATDPGCVRVNNEDNFAIEEDLGLLLVADGMGGHNSGEVASDIATQTVRDFARKMIGGPRQLVPEGGDPKASARARQLEHFIKIANTMIYEKGRAFPRDAGMGTTVVAVLADCRSLTLAHVGDSRAYLFRRGHLQQLTEDHSLVTEQVRRGLISAAEAAKSNLQNILTRALGAEKDVAVDVCEQPLMPGDVVLLASDGLTKMVDDDAVARTIAAAPSARCIVDSLIAQARQAGGVDNVTVIAARVPGARRDPFRNFVARILGR